MISYSTVILSLFISTVVYGLWTHVIKRHLSPARLIPGPPSPNMLLGVFYDLHMLDPLPLFKEWEQKYGRVVGVKGPMGVGEACEPCLDTD